MSRASAHAENLIYMVGTKVSCSVADLVSVVDSRADADRGLMEFAKATKLHSLPRAKEYLANYLNGTGVDKRFALADLLRQDPGVREIVKRHFRASHAPLTRKNWVTVGQLAYTNPDWKNALGTYFVYYVDLPSVRTPLGQQIPLVLAWGEDTYQWHPDDSKRWTQCIHQAASRLQTVSTSQLPIARPFRMLGSEVVIDTTTGMPWASPLRSEAIAAARSRGNSRPHGLPAHYMGRSH